jgi:hypothetical protein
MSSITTSTAIPEPHPVRLVVDDDLRRTRLTVALRLVLAIPHLLVLLVWSVAAVPVVIVAWVTTLAGRRPAGVLVRFFTAYVRYLTRVGAYLAIVADPFPPFGGPANGYPVDVDVDPPGEQRRWGVAFRIILAVPALVILNALQGVLQVVGVFAWVYALVTGRIHPGLRAVGVYCLRYQAQTLAYVTFLTARYPSLSGIG